LPQHTHWPENCLFFLTALTHKMNAKTRGLNIDLLATIAKCFTCRIQCGANETFLNGSDPFYLVLK